MTECSSSLTLFCLPAKPVVIPADGGALTSEAGALLLGQLDTRLALTEGLARCLSEGRDLRKVRHSLLALVRQRVYPIGLGYEDANDADRLRFEPALKLAVGKAPSSGRLSPKAASSCAPTAGWRGRRWMRAANSKAFPMLFPCPRTRA